MKSNATILIVSTLLVLLFAYTAISKFLDFETFRGQMLNQPLPISLSSQLAWAVPLIELVVAIMLIRKFTRLMGLALSLVLMAAFTIYVGLIVANAFDRVPCSCGAIMESLSWKGHLAVNIFFLILSTIGFILEMRKKRYRTTLLVKYRDRLPILVRGRQKGKAENPKKE